MSSDENLFDSTANAEIVGRVLVVDDDQVCRTLHRAILAEKFDVLTASSGDDALAACREHVPDLVLLDVEMPGLNGFETCRQLREWTTVPIIFVTAHRSLEKHLMAYDAGGDDIITKPIDKDILTRKIILAIRHHAEQQKLAAEKNSLQSMAMSFLSTMGEGGVLLNFMRASIACHNYQELAQKLVDAIGEYGAQCNVLIRHGVDSTTLTSHGEPTELERSILEQASNMGRVFQFKRQLAVNYDRVSIIVSNLPEDDAEKVGRIRDNVTILAETTEALSENVGMRQESMARAEQMQISLMSATRVVESLRAKQRNMLADSRVLLHELTDSVEKTYSWLGIGGQQERAISETMFQSVDRILALLASGESDHEFEQVLQALRGNTTSNEVDLF